MAEVAQLSGTVPASVTSSTGQRRAALKAPTPASVSGPGYGGRLVITGASGFVGRNLVRAFRGLDLVAVTGFSQIPPRDDAPPFTRRERLDLRDPESAARLIDATAPDAVIHLAGNKNVRFCEQNPEEATAINREGTRHLVEACRRAGAKLVYVSTDLVFDGELGGYREDSLPRPSTVYGRTKLAGEGLALAGDARALVCRTGGLYGTGSPLLAWLTREFDAGRPVEAFQDVVSTPTSTEDLAAAIDVALTLDACGILHVVGPQAVSRYEWFSLFATTFGYPEELAMPAVAGARRAEMLLPRDVSLDAGASRARIGFSAAGPRAGLERLFRTEAAR